MGAFPFFLFVVVVFGQRNGKTIVSCVPLAILCPCIATGGIDGAQRKLASTLNDISISEGVLYS